MRLFHGWVIVAAGIAITCVGLGSITTFGVFLQPMAQEMGWSRTGISAAATFAFLAMGVASFAWGAASDRFGASPVVLAGGVLLGLAFALAARAGSLLQFQLCFGVLGGGAAGAFAAPLTASAARWFTRHRSLAVALVTAGLGIGSMTIAPLSRALITGHGWRFAMEVLGGLVWLVAVPAALLLRPPPVGAACGPAPGRVAAVLRSPQFIAVAATFFACCAAHSGPIFHMVTYAMECGVPAMTAATAFGAMGLAGLAGRDGGGLLADRVGAKPVILAGLAVQAVVVGLFLLTWAPASFYGLGIVFGLSYGAVMPLYAILLRAWFGPEVMGTAVGAAMLASTLGMALGPWAGGMLYDGLGSYAWLFVGSCGIGLGAVAIAASFRPPRLASA